MHEADILCRTDTEELRQQPAHAVANAALRLLADREQELLLRSIFGPLTAASLVTKCGASCRLPTRICSWLYSCAIVAQCGLARSSAFNAIFAVYQAVQSHVKFLLHTYMRSCGHGHCGQGCAAVRPRVKGNGKMDSENIRAYVMKIIMERLQPTAEKAQKDSTTPQELADYRLRHGVLAYICKSSCQPVIILSCEASAARVTGTNTSGTRTVNFHALHMVRSALQQEVCHTAVIGKLIPCHNNRKTSLLAREACSIADCRDGLHRGDHEPDDAAGADGVRDARPRRRRGGPVGVLWAAAVPVAGRRRKAVRAADRQSSRGRASIQPTPGSTACN